RRRQPVRRRRGVRLRQQPRRRAGTRRSGTPPRAPGGARIAFGQGDVYTFRIPARRGGPARLRSTNRRARLHRRERRLRLRAHPAAPSLGSGHWRAEPPRKEPMNGSSLLPIASELSPAAEALRTSSYLHVGRDRVYYPLTDRTLGESEPGYTELQA